jgi:hypothetical protein
MAHKESFGRRLAILLGASLAFSLGVAIAQTPASQPADLSAGAQVSRLAGDWRSTAAVAVPFSQPPAASSDLGVTPSGTRLERMLLLLSPSSDEQTALTAELANQQNSASSEYHHWLTPSEFAAAYANSAADVAAVSGWLEAQGFQVAPLPASRGWIEFSGTAAQVEQTFHTQVHFVATLQGTRAALVSGISVPAALLPLVDGLVSLDGGLSTPALTTPRPVAVSAAELAARTSPNSAEALTPQLAAQLLHLDALHTAGVLGAGESIAIPTRSNVRASDIAAFRSVFSLPVSPLAVLPNGPDPGRTADESEAVLAASWAGAAAPGAQIVLVPAANTGATDGLDLALASVVDQALAHTVSVGYSACEASLSAAHQAFYAALYQQAAAEGMAVVAAVGDSGPSACQAAGSEEPCSMAWPHSVPAGLPRALRCSPPGRRPTLPIRPMPVAAAKAPCIQRPHGSPFQMQRRPKQALRQPRTTVFCPTWHCLPPWTTASIADWLSASAVPRLPAAAPWSGVAAALLPRPSLPALPPWWRKNMVRRAILPRISTRSAGGAEFSAMWRREAHS